MKVSVEEITPEKAAEWLAANAHNRNVKDQHVARLAGAIQRGEWKPNGDSIKFNGAGLLDGQHRLLAVIKAGAPIVSVVVRGLEEAAQDTVDTGVRRTLSDVLKLRGETDCNTLAAALTMLFKAQRGAEALKSADNYPTHAQALALLEETPELRLSPGRRLRKLGISDALAQYLYYRFRQIDRDDADFFFEKLAEGTDLSEGHPIWALRQALSRDVVASRPMTPLVKQAVVIKAWNAFRRGDELRLVIWRPGGSRPEKFPKPE